MKKTISIFLIVLCAVVLLFAALFMFDLIRLIDLHIPAEVSSVHVTDTLHTGETLEITDAETLRGISDLVEELKPAIGIRSNQNGSQYHIRFCDTKGASILELTVVSESQLQLDGYFINTDTTSLIARLDALFY